MIRPECRNGIHLKPETLNAHLFSNTFRVSLLMVAMISFLVNGTISSAQTHPSGVASRLLISVQNPTPLTSGTRIINRAYSLQIADAVSLAIPGNQPVFTGWTSAMPINIENLPLQSVAVVNNEDGSASLLNTVTESVTTPNIGSTLPNAGTALTMSLRYLFVANSQSGQVTVTDRQSTNPPVNLSLPGVMNISFNFGSTVVMAFATDNNVAYFVRHLSTADSSAYSGGSSHWPSNAQDCEPFTLPTFCLLQVTSSGVSGATYAQANFDHPVKAVDSAVEGNMYILNSGLQNALPSAHPPSVTVIPISSLFLEDGAQTGIPAVPVRYLFTGCNGTTTGGADNAVTSGTTLYVAGQGRISNGLWAGELTTVNLTTGAVSCPLPMADGVPVRMVVADDSTLWIGSIHCNTGYNERSGGRAGCLTIANLATTSTPASIAYVEPFLCSVENLTSCATGDYPSHYTYQGGGGGDVTGIAPIIGTHKVVYIEHGQIHIRGTSVTSTKCPTLQNPITGAFVLCPNNLLSISGVATDVVFLDGTNDSDGTAIGTTH